MLCAYTDIIKIDSKEGSKEGSNDCRKSQDSSGECCIYILKPDRICTVMTTESLIIDWAKKANEVEINLIRLD